MREGGKLVGYGMLWGGTSCTFGGVTAKPSTMLSRGSAISKAGAAIRGKLRKEH